MSLYNHCLFPYVATFVVFNLFFYLFCICAYFL
uniref:Uncharacterized protein n=1 Tax=Anguilla anguilla TaxID=7936 RepID=A0A0E9RN06_ANGAN